MEGDFIGLLGPSGSGKSTLLRTILGTAHVFRGDVLIDGRSAIGKRRRLGYVPQLETIDWNFPVTVREVVMMGKTMTNPWFPWNKHSDKVHAFNIMDRLGIADISNEHIRALSGGQQQRVFLARALISSPRILILDEPTSGVDIKTRHEVMHLLQDLNDDGITIVMTTHEINAVALHLPWLICLNGHIVASGRPNDVINSDTLRATYGADMPVISHEGMPIVVETPRPISHTGETTLTITPTHKN
jgi:zinc/manganese transport system ATP-binding protein